MRHRVKWCRSKLAALLPCDTYAMTVIGYCLNAVVRVAGRDVCRVFHLFTDISKNISPNLKSLMWKDYVPRCTSDSEALPVAVVRYAQRLGAK